MRRTGLSVFVPMVDVGVMRMFMRHGRVPMKMTVRFPPIPLEIVLMLVMQVVDVAVSVFHRFMRVFMSVALGQVQPDPQAHQAGRQPESRQHRFVQEQDGNGRTDERRRGEVGPRAC